MSVSEQQMQQCPNCGEYVPADYVVCVYCGFDLTGEIIKRSKIKISYISAIKRNIQLLTKPFQTMKEIAFFPDQKGPFLNLYLIALLMTLQIQVLVGKFYTGLDPQFNVLVQLTVFITAPLLFYILFFITIKIMTWITALILRIIGAKSIDKSQIKSVLGYSSFAVAIGQFIGLFLMLFLPRKSVTINYATISSVLDSYQHHPLIYLYKFFYYVAWLYAMVLATYGISKSSKISYFEAFIALIPSAAIISFLII